MKSLPALVASLFLTLSVLPNVNGATIVASGAQTNTDRQNTAGNTGLTFTGYNSTSTQAHSGLVVVVSGERTLGTSGTVSVTYGGAALTRVAVMGNTGGATYASIWYLANPALAAGSATANIQVNMQGTGNGYVGAAMMLNSTEAIHWVSTPSPYSSGATALKLDYGANPPYTEGLIVEAVERNNDVGTGSFTGPGGSGNLFDISSGNGGFATKGSYFAVDPRQDIERDYGTTSNRIGGVGVLFVAPEPSRALLLLLGGVFCITRRMRR